MTSPTIDGSTSGTSSGGTTLSLSLTTTKTNDVIAVLVNMENNTNTPLTVVSVVATGLTFSLRKGLSVSNGTSATRTEFWWAPATAVFSGTITITFSGTIDDSAGVAFGVNGCNSISSPFDSNSGLPYSASSSSSVPSVSVSTSQADDLLVSLTTFEAGGQLPNLPPSGYTQLNYAYNPGGAAYAAAGVGYKSVSSAQSAVTTTSGQSARLNMALMIDAFTADASGGGGGGGTSLQTAVSINT